MNQHDPLAFPGRSSAGSLRFDGCSRGLGAPIEFQILGRVLLHSALVGAAAHAMRELIVTDDAGRIVGLLDEGDVTRVYQSATAGRQS
ncbi:MAG: hypothetical protein M3O46_01790 [Myxococcota bacterium]|nr:hypothetical protein [Myxococcota bacterium]